MAQLSDTDRARQASAILDNALFTEAFSTLREGYLMQLMACAPTDNEGRWRYAAAMRGLAVIRNHLEFVLKKGEISHAALQQIAAEEKRQSVFKRAVRGFFSDDIGAEKTIA